MIKKYLFCKITIIYDVNNLQAFSATHTLYTTIIQPSYIIYHLPKIWDIFLKDYGKNMIDQIVIDLDWVFCTYKIQCSRVQDLNRFLQFNPQKCIMYTLQDEGRIHKLELLPIFKCFVAIFVLNMTKFYNIYSHCI